MHDGNRNAHDSAYEKKAVRTGSDSRSCTAKLTVMRRLIYPGYSGTFLYRTDAKQTPPKIDEIIIHIFSVKVNSAKQVASLPHQWYNHHARGCVGIGIQCGLKIRRPMGLRVRVSSPPP